MGAGVPDVAFDGAALRYGPGLPRALDGVNLELAPGSTLAVTGSSGAGKSSLVNALLRFWPLEDGSLTVGGTDVTRLAATDARAVCALADQRAHLFAGTVRGNLVLGRPEASESEIGAALAAARLDAWVAGLPEGLDTPVGDDGVALSGGERRRLAVARALLSPGPVVVLDEPTSALDPELADHVVRGVLAAAAASGRSVLVVTHRQAEADRCAGAVALEAGRVVAARP
jgi:ABC-type multidrug transport system fused ATPase/permease subunit